MSNPVNLNKVRKARKRAEKTEQANANAVTFGLTKSQRNHAKIENLRAARRLDEKTVERPANSENDDQKKP